MSGQRDIAAYETFFGGVRRIYGEIVLSQMG